MMREPFSIKNRIMKQNRGLTKQTNYQDYLESLKTYMRSPKGVGNDIMDEEYNNLNTKALLGDAGAVMYFMNEIHKFNRKNPYSGQIPAAYSTLTEALFHDWKGFGAAARWLMDRSYRMSSGLQIIGTDIYYAEKSKYKIYPYKMQSMDHVERLTRTFLRNNEYSTLDFQDDSEELKMNDPLWPGRFIRIAMWDRPRVWDGFTTITLRRQVVDLINLEDQAGTGSIPYEAIPMLKHLVSLRLNTIVAGPVGSGKTTFANTLIDEQLKQSKEPQGVIMIEKHPESIIPHVIKGHRIVPIQADDDNLMNIGIDSLRHDPNIMFMSEMRYYEWAFYLFAGKKGYDSLMASYHTKDSEDIPYQGAQAAHSILGGTLRGHLFDALQTCQLVLIMETQKNGSKVLSRISEIYYNKEEESVVSIDLMRYNFDKKDWEYNDELSPDFYKKIDKQHNDEYDFFLNKLSELANRSRLHDTTKVSYSCNAVLRG